MTSTSARQVTVAPRISCTSSQRSGKDGAGAAAAWAVLSPAGPGTVTDWTVCPRGPSCLLTTNSSSGVG